MSLILITLSVLMVVKNSPMKSSFLVVLLSIFVSLVVYSIWSSMFSMCVIILSFSSGMMVLFLYCASCFNYESSMNKIKKIFIFLSLLSVIMLSPSSHNTIQENLEKSSTYINLPNLIMLMVILIMSMSAINKVMLNPSKKMMKIY